MSDLAERLDLWATEASRRIADLTATPRLERIGRIIHVGDGVARVAGLPDAALDELSSLRRHHRRRLSWKGPHRLRPPRQHDAGGGWADRARYRADRGGSRR